MIIGSVNNLEAARRYLSEMALAQSRLEPWRFLRQNDFYNPNPASPTSFHVPNDALSVWKRGIPLRWASAGQLYYGAVSNITEGDGLVGIFGPSMSGMTIDALWAGQPERTVTKEITLLGEYGGLTGNIGYDLGHSRRWMGAPAYLVGASLRHTVNKTGGTYNPDVNLFIYDDPTYYEVATADVTVSTTEQYMYTVDPDSYRIVARNTFGFYGKVADDGSPHAKNLNGTLIFVLE